MGTTSVYKNTCDGCGQVKYESEAYLPEKWERLRVPRLFVPKRKRKGDPKPPKLIIRNGLYCATCVSHFLDTSEAIRSSKLTPQDSIQTRDKS